MIGYSRVVLVKMVVLVMMMMVLMVMLVMVKMMMMVMLIRGKGSEAMIGYSRAVLATDRGTEEQPTDLKGALIALDTSKYSQY